MREIEDAYRDMNYEDVIDFAHFVGHTMTLAMPDKYGDRYKRWTLEDLPIIPEKFKLVHTPGTSKIYKDIKTKIENNHYDYIINACDAAREGELIFWNFYDSLSLKNLPPVKRLWAQDTTKNTLQKALNNLIDEDNVDIKRLGEAAKLRSYWDWLLGINLSRAVSLKADKTMAIGRVMTSTLYLIVKRDLEIKNFKSESSYELHGKAKNKNNEFIDFQYIPDKNSTRPASKKDLAKINPKTLKVTSVEKENKKEYAPLAYSLSDLQRDANNVYKFSAKKTLNLAQSLYEKHKILSYPRTDSRFIPTEVAKNIRNYIKGILEIDELKVNNKYLDTDKIDNFYKNKRYVDNKKITDHHGLLPTVKFKPEDLKRLSADERKVFMLVARRIYQIFLKDYEYEKTTVMFKDGENEFRATGSVLQEIGFKRLWNTRTLLNIATVVEGEVLDVVSLEIKEIKSRPKSPYTEASLLADMINVGKEVKNNDFKKILKDVGGLGTAATRAEIISKLISYKYVEVKKSYLYPTELGKELIKEVENYSFSKPDTTARWEMTLAEVEDGKKNEKEVMEEFMAYINDNVSSVTEEAEKQLREQNGATVGKCPRCGEDVLITKWSYACQNYKNQDGGPTCDFSVGRTVCEADIDVDDIGEMLNGGKSKVKDMTFKSGNSGKVQLSINSDDGSLNFNFVNESLGKCPSCGKNVIKTKNYYLCENYKGDVDPCDFIVGKNIMSANISENDVKKLLNGEKIKKNFTWKNGNKSEAFLVVKDGRTEFEFPDRK